MILWRVHHTSRDSLELPQHWWRSASSGTVLSFDWGAAAPAARGRGRQQNQPWHSLIVLKGHQLLWKSPRVPLPRLPLELLKQVARVKLLLRDAQQSLWTAQRSDCHTTMCPLQSSAPTPLNRQCKEPFKCQSSRAARTKCFLFLSLRSWQIKNRLSVLAEWPHLPAGYVIPWQRAARALQ